MRIEELLIESHNLEEGPGWDQAKQGLGQMAQGVGNVAKGAVAGIPGTVGGAAKGVGAVAGGLRGAWDKAKQGYNAGRAAVGGDAVPGTQQAGGQQAAAGSAPVQSGGQDPNQLRQQGKALIKQADDLEKQQKSQGQQAQAGQQQGSQVSGPTGSQSNADGGANAAPAPGAEQGQEAPADQAGANAFGQMAQGLGGAEDPNAPTQSNTGGTTTPTSTGVKHTANPNNPNNPQGQQTASAEQPAATTPPAEQPTGQTAPPAGQQPAPATTNAPSKQDKKAMKNQYKQDVNAAQAAAAKPGFQQDAMDKMAQKKVNLGDGPKINAYGKQYEEFESRFLGMMI